MKEGLNETEFSMALEYQTDKVSFLILTKEACHCHSPAATGRTLDILKTAI